jgi:DnaJ-domain-containing protein 1
MPPVVPEQPAVRPLPVPPAVKPAAPPVVAMPVEDAYKVLKATSGSTWESIEQTRRLLVQQSHPERLKAMTAERRSSALAEAKRVNAAYATLSRMRCGGH